MVSVKSVPFICSLLLVSFTICVCATEPGIPASSPSTAASASAMTSSAAASSSSAATSEKEGSTVAAPASSGRQTVNYRMTETQYCSACHSLVEEFYRWTLTNVHRNNMNMSFSHSELMESYCRQTEPFFKVFHDFYQQACLKLIQDYHTDILSPFMGLHKAAEFLVLNEVYAHKISACERLGACRPLPADMIESPTTSYSECGKCERLVYTGEKLLRREKLDVITPTRVRNYVNALCQEIGLHFRYPIDLEEYCRDQQEEFGEDLQQKFIDFFISDSYKNGVTAALATETGAPAVVLVSQTNPQLRKNVCVELIGDCAKTKEEKKEHREHEKKRVENLKKKKAKNPFAPKPKVVEVTKDSKKDEL